MAPPIVTRFLISFNENKIIGFILFLLITGISVVIALQQPEPEEEGPPSYKAIGRLALNTPPPTFTQTGQELQSQGRAVNLTTLLSPRVLRNVTNRLQRGGFKFTIEDIQEIIKDKKLLINLPNNEQGGDSDRLITLEYKDQRIPRVVQRVLLVFMEELTAESYRINTLQWQDRIDSLQERLQVVQRDLNRAERKFYNYITTEGADLIAVQNGSLFAGITSSQEQQRQLQVILSGIDGEINSLQELLGLTPDEAYTSSALSADPIIANLRAEIFQNELQLERLSEDLRDEHPTIVEIKKQMAANEELYEQRAEELIGDDGILEPLTPKIREASNLDPIRAQLANRLVALEAQKNAINQQLESAITIEANLREQYQSSPNKQLRQARLIQEVQSQRILYQTIFSALIDARAAKVETVSSLLIAQRPFLAPLPPPRTVDLLNPFVIIAIGMGLGVVSSLGVIFLLATLDERLHTPSELRESLADRGVPVLGVLPVVRSQTSSGRIIPLIINADSDDLPSYERFRSNIRRLSPDNTKVVLITSISDQEGKSVSAYNLAIASAYAGKRTLLVEADLRDRNPCSLQYLGIEPYPEAVNYPLGYYDLHRSGEDSFQDEMIQRVPELPNFSIVASPGYQQQAAAIIESSEMQSFLKYVRAQYDLVILDTPSLERCNDALLLEPFADGLILVTRPGVTLKNLLGTTIDEFVEVELPLIGAVINEVDLVHTEMDFDSSDSESSESAQESDFPLKNNQQDENEGINF